MPSPTNAASDSPGPQVLCVGIATIDRVFSVLRHPETPGKHRALDRTVVGGGVAANAAVTVARLGGTARLLGVTGDDEAGRAIVAALQGEGVDVSAVRVVPDRLSPESVVLVDATGERLIVNHASPDLFSIAALPDEREIGHPSAVLTDMRWPAAASAALTAARRLGIPGVVDCDHSPEDAPGVIEQASHVVFGHSTLSEWIGSDDPGIALERASDRLGAWVAVTTGPDGTWWLDDRAVRHAPAFEIDTVDTLGAGDVFHGAFALGLAEGMDEPDAVRFGSAAAALKCTRFGGRDGIPTREEVNDFLRMER